MAEELSTTKVLYHPWNILWTIDAANGNDNTIPNIHCSKFTTFNQPYSVAGMAHPL